MLTLVLAFTALAAEAQRSRASIPRQPDPSLPTHPLGGFAVSQLISAAGIEEPRAMTAIGWRLRATVRGDNEHRFHDLGWLSSQNMSKGIATIHVWRERDGLYCRTDTLTLPIEPGANVIVPMNATRYADGDMIWFEYWPSYTLYLEAATSFGVWSTFGSITQSPSTNEPHPWWQIVEPSRVSCD